MVPSDATKKPQGNRTRRPAVQVAIPLTYTQRRSQVPDAPDKKEVNTTVTECPICPPTSPPTASDAATGQQPAATTSAIPDPSLDDRTQIADQTKDQAPSAAVSKPGQALDENIESTDNRLGHSHNVKAASPALSDIKALDKASPITDSKHSLELRGGFLHGGKVSLPTANKSLEMAGSMSSPPGPALDAHKPVLPPNVASTPATNPSIAGARTSMSNEPKAATATRRGSGAISRHKAGVSQSGQPDMRAASIAAATIKALQEIAKSRQQAAAELAMHLKQPLPESQAPSDESVRHAPAPIRQSTTTPIMPQRHVQDLRNGMTSPETTEPAANYGLNSTAGLRYGSLANPSFRDELDMRHRMHQSHPSHGSMNFGSHPGSVHSSPAPHMAGGGHQLGPYPPPPQPMHSAMSTFPAFPPGLGYSPQPTPQMMHSPSHGNFAHHHHHSQSFGPSPSRTPGMENHQHFGHSPAHSLHAQTPLMHAQQMDGPGFGQSPLSGMMNGNGVHPQNGLLIRNVFRGPPMRPSDAGDSLDGLPNYIQMQFNNPSFADFQLEVRFPASDGQQQSSIFLPGHSMLLARSPCLGRLMASGFTQIHHNGMPSRLITLDLQHDGFVRPDAFWIALQRLYGGQLLLEGYLPGPNATPIEAMVMTEKFNFSVGYAAAGHILQMEPIVHRGMDLASHFLDWDTLLKALEIANASLDLEVSGGLGAEIANEGAESRLVLGPIAELRMSEAAMGFILSRFPHEFQLDKTVADPKQLRRLPKPNSFVKKHNQKLSLMKFGEFGLDDGAEDVDGKDAKSAVLATLQAILSAVLLNLPFPYLKFLLESDDLGSRDGGLNAAQRQKVITVVINEREKRRVQAAKIWQHRPLDASQLMAQSPEIQQEKTLWWQESVVVKGEGVVMVRELMKNPFAYELSA